MTIHSNDQTISNLYGIGEIGDRGSYFVVESLARVGQESRLLQMS